MNASEPSFSINISPIEDQLLSYDSAVRATALSAIERLSKRVREQMVYTCSESSFLQVDCEGDFEILFEAFSDRFDALDISFAETRPTETSGAFVVRRGETVHALRITNHHDGVRPTSAAIRSPQTESGLDGGQRQGRAFTLLAMAHVFTQALVSHTFGAAARSSASVLTTSASERASPYGIPSLEPAPGTRCFGALGGFDLGPSHRVAGLPTLGIARAHHHACLDLFAHLPGTATIEAASDVGGEGRLRGGIDDVACQRSAAVLGAAGCTTWGEDLSLIRLDLRSSSRRAQATLFMADADRLDREAPGSGTTRAWNAPEHPLALTRSNVGEGSHASAGSPH